MVNSGDRATWEVFDRQLSAVPGGTSLHPAVMRNMQRPYVNPWADEFLAYFDETLVLLKQLYNTRNDVLVMTGPIRLAMDSVVCSLLEPGDKAAVMTVNGRPNVRTCITLVEDDMRVETQDGLGQWVQV